MPSELVRVIGPQPPPRHGVSAVNESVARLLESREFELEVLNTAPAGLGRGVAVRISRWSRLLRASFGLLRRRGGVSYFSLSGGYGLIYEIGLTVLARLRAQRVIVHHHSFRYLDAPFFPMRCLVRAAGPSAVHIVLGEIMGRRLREGYPEVGPLLVLSNAAFMPGRDECAIWTPERGRRVGHLSNLSPDKGLWEVLATARAALQRGDPWEFVLAGPFESTIVEAEFIRRASRLDNVRYVGPVYGTAKDDFFAQVGVLLFPSQYRNEAEPLVIHEGLRAGCAIVAYDRGCIAGLLDESCGRLVSRIEDFSAAALDAIDLWSGAEGKGPAISAGARQRAKKLKLEAEGALENFLKLFTLQETNL